MAKVLCDNLAAWTFSEQCEITLDRPEYQEYINSALNANGFWKQPGAAQQVLRLWAAGAEMLPPAGNRGSTTSPPTLLLSR